jgi:hypothetical protein
MSRQIFGYGGQTAIAGDTNYFFRIPFFELLDEKPAGGSVALASAFFS